MLIENFSGVLLVNRSITVEFVLCLFYQIRPPWTLSFTTGSFMSTCFDFVLPLLLLKYTVELLSQNNFIGLCELLFAT